MAVPFNAFIGVALLLHVHVSNTLQSRDILQADHALVVVAVLLLACPDCVLFLCVDRLE